MQNHLITPESVDTVRKNNQQLQCVVFIIARESAKRDDGQVQDQNVINFFFVSSLLGDKKFELIYYFILPFVTQLRRVQSSELLSGSIRGSISSCSWRSI